MHMGHDLAVIGGKFVIGCFGVAAIGQMVIQHAEIVHLPNSVWVVWMEVLAHKNLVDGFKNAAKCRSKYHISQ